MIFFFFYLMRNTSCDLNSLFCLNALWSVVVLVFKEAVFSWDSALIELEAVFEIEVTATRFHIEWKVELLYQCKLLYVLKVFCYVLRCYHLSLHCIFMFFFFISWSTLLSNEKTYKLRYAFFIYFNF